MRFTDYGTSLSSESGRSLFATARSVMDKFELKNHPRGGNVLTFSKKVK